MMWYLAVYRPFTETWTNILNFYNEFVIFILVNFLLLISSFGFDSNIINICGWTMIGLIMLSLFVTWALMIPKAFKELVQSITEFFYPPKNEPISTPSKTDEVIQVKQSIRKIEIITENKKSAKLRTDSSSGGSSGSGRGCEKISSLADLKIEAQNSQNSARNRKCKMMKKGKKPIKGKNTHVNIDSKNIVVNSNQVKKTNANTKKEHK